MGKSSLGQRVERLTGGLPDLTRNPVSLAGLAIALGAGAILLVTLITATAGGRTNPYTGLIVYLVVPAVFTFGLLLVPVGALIAGWRRRRSPLGVAGFERYPVLDLNLPRHRGLVLGFGVATVFVLALIGTASVRAVAYMDTPAFCGSCHGVMAPEATAYRESPHARVDCVACHIGPGADWYVKSKLSGAGQVIAYTLNTYPRPIPAPIKDLRPAQETCEQCHWPDKFFGDRAVARPHFGLDEANTGSLTTFVIRTGGGSASRASSGGIHWHMNTKNQVRYVAADRGRQQIPWVEVTDPNGVKTVYQDASAPLSPADLAASEKRQMDCMDCHNRPTHNYRSPDEALDALLDEGAIDRTIPFVKREAVMALIQPYPDTTTALRSIADRLDTFYRTSYPAVYAAKRGSINRAIEEVQRVYQTNFFPEMKVDWRTYPDNIGHQEGAGCFRCHDGKHVSADGKVVSYTCETCHSLPETKALETTGPSMGRLISPPPAPTPSAAPAPAATAAPAATVAPTATAMPTATATSQPTPVPPTATAVQPTPTSAPAATPAATTAPAAKPTVAPATGPAAIPHDLVGRESCLTCHSAGSLAVPASHAGRTNETCVACHKPRT